MILLPVLVVSTTLLASSPTPQTPAVEAGMAAQAILRALGRDPLGTLADCPTPSCACWACVLRAHSEVVYHQVVMRVAREAAQEVD